MSFATPHVEIAGAGIAGLSAAVLLGREGWSVRVHEQAHEIGELGAGLLLKPNSTKILRETGVFQRLPNSPATVTASSIRDRSGNVISHYMHAGALTMYCPLRQELSQALRETAEALHVQVSTSSPVRSAKPAGALVLEDGSEYTADLVVGADGWRSDVRESVGLGDKVAKLGHGATRMVVPRRSHELEDTYQELVAGPMRVGLTPVAPDLLYVFFSCPEDDEQGSAVPIDADYWGAAVPGLSADLLDRLAAASAVRHAYSYVRVPSWHRQRVALVGDAVNALPPTLAQGAGLAIMNAEALSTELAQASTLAEGLANWERRYRRVTEQTQRWSMRYLKASNSWLATRRLVQPYMLAASRSSLLNRRMRIADRTVVGQDGPVEITHNHTLSLDT